MFARALKAGDELQQVVFVDARLGNDGAQCRLAFREGSRLVDDECVNLAEYFQRLRISDEDAGASPATGAHHNGHGSGEPESAWAGYDQNGHSIDECMSKARLRPSKIPDDEGDNGRNDDSRNKVRGHLICQSLNRGP